MAAEGFVPIWAVFLLTMLMAAATGIGALPFAFIKGQLSPTWSGLSSAIACGFMLAASFDLVHEGQPYGAGSVLVGLVAGLAFISYSHSVLDGYEDMKVLAMSGADARRTTLMLGVMTLHAFGEGSGVGVAYSGQRGWAQGLLVTAAIGLHNIPEGLAICMVLVARGVSPMRAMLWSIATSLPQPMVAVPAYAFVEAFKPLLPLGMGFAAGCMVWLCFADLLPECLKEINPSLAGSATTLSAISLEAFRMFLEHLEHPSSAARIAPALHAAAAGVMAAVGGLGIVMMLSVIRVPPGGVAGCAAGLAAGLAIVAPVIMHASAMLTLVGFIELVVWFGLGLAAYHLLDKMRLHRLLDAAATPPPIDKMTNGKHDDEEGGGTLWKRHPDIRSNVGLLSQPTPQAPNRLITLTVVTVSCYAAWNGAEFGVLVGGSTQSQQPLFYFLLPAFLRALPASTLAACTLYYCTKSMHVGAFGAIGSGTVQAMSAMLVVFGNIDGKLLNAMRLRYFQYAAAGLMLAYLLRELIPRLRGHKSRWKLLGLWLGFCLASCSYTFTLLLCTMTPYCGSSSAL